jgi:antitoxin ParD1/3/4
MNVSLTPQLEAMIHEKVESGMYNNASKVVREALRLLDYHDRERRLRAEVAIAPAQIERDETIPWTPELVARIKANAAEDLRLNRPFKDALLP